ncbi:uncharacterized protein [Malus domestica]|uniref:uncharacterized protein isoform X2 n=1 Tax=Malus domestica TaxID=3750 RepID=UPI003975687A
MILCATTATHIRFSICVGGNIWAFWHRVFPATGIRYRKLDVFNFWSNLSTRGRPDGWKSRALSQACKKHYVERLGSMKKYVPVVSLPSKSFFRKLFNHSVSWDAWVPILLFLPQKSNVILTTILYHISLPY